MNRTGSARRRLVEELRDEPPALDDVTRARMERRVLDGTGRRAPARGTREMVFLGAAVGAAFALLLCGAWVTWRVTIAPSETAAAPSVTFETIAKGIPVRRGMFAQGETIETGEGQHVRARVAASRFQIAPRTRVRFTRLAPQRVDVLVMRGTISVEFNPARRGEERLTVVTPTARVEVVGTGFTVDVGADGETRVRVLHGLVRVIPKRPGREILLHRGEAAIVQANGTLVATPSAQSLPLPPPASARAARVALASSSSQPLARAERRAALPIAARARSAGLTPAPTPAPTQTPTPTPTPTPTQTQTPAAPEPQPAPPTAQAPEPPPSPAAANAPDAGTAAAAEARVLQHYESIARSSRAPARQRLRALMDLADAHRRRERFVEEAAALERAAALPLPGAHEAMFALGRVREQSLRDRAGARDAYHLYLARAPRGSLALEARRALCRLGDATACPGTLRVRP